MALHMIIFASKGHCSEIKQSHSKSFTLFKVSLRAGFLKKDIPFTEGWLSW